MPWSRMRCRNECSRARPLASGNRWARSRCRRRRAEYTPAPVQRFARRAPFGTAIALARDGADLGKRARTARRNEVTGATSPGGIDEYLGFHRPRLPAPELLPDRGDPFRGMA